jgi:hypothetical protein
MRLIMHAMSNAAAGATLHASAEFGFIPDTLRAQCRNLVRSYHAMHGYSCLPDLLWKAGLSGFIDRHRDLREALRKATTTRSARTANSLLEIIATDVLALEVLAREYANWSVMLPAAKIMAAELLEENTPASRTWLMEHYLYPPRYGSRTTPIAYAAELPSL